MKRLFLGFSALLVTAGMIFAAQHDYVIDNNPGATFRSDLNSALQAIVTNNAGATEPATTYPDMWWYDTSTSLMKRRNNANDAWIIMGLEAADTDGTLAANSDSKVPTQKATKTYADTKAAKGANSDITSITGLTTPLARSQGGLASTAANNAASGPVFLDANSKLPAVDGSLLTGIGTGGHAIYTTAGSTSWTAPAGVTKVLVTAIGAGGGGGASWDQGVKQGGGGGGGACAFRVPVAVTAGNSYTVVVGAKGVGQASGDGTNGGNSTFNSTSVVAGGGAGGIKAYNGAGAAGGSGGALSGSVTVFGTWNTSVNASGATAGGTGGLSSGGNGAAGSATSGGAGGGSAYGTGGAGTGTNNGTGYGAGGSGAAGNTSNGTKGADGTDGLVILEW